MNRLLPFHGPVSLSASPEDLSEIETAKPKMKRSNAMVNLTSTPPNSNAQFLDDSIASPSASVDAMDIDPEESRSKESQLMDSEDERFLDSAPVSPDLAIYRVLQNQEAKKKDKRVSRVGDLVKARRTLRFDSPLPKPKSKVIDIVSGSEEEEEHYTDANGGKVALIFVTCRNCNCKLAIDVKHK